MLISLYYKEDPLFLDQCFESIWNDQTIKPSEIILVLDGPLGNLGEFKHEVRQFEKSYDNQQAEQISLMV